MFKPKKVKKFRVIFHQRMHDNVIANLHEAGVIQLKEITELETARKKVTEEIHRLSSLLSKFKEMEEFLGRPPLKPVTVKEHTFEQILNKAEKSLEKLEPKVGTLRERNEKLKQQQQTLLAQLELLHRLEAVRAPLSCLRSTEEIKVTVGTIAEENVDGFLMEVEKDMAGVVFASSAGAGKRRIVIVACRAKDYQKLSPLLYRFEVELLEIPPFLGTPSSAAERLKSELFELESKEKKLTSAVKKLTKSKAPEVLQIRELLEIQRERLEAAGLFGYTDSTVVLEGWAHEKRLPVLQKLLDKSTKGHNIFRAFVPTSEEIESVPVELENPKVMRDFEYITGMYGLPRYDEVDPTPFLTLTFPLFFAIALSDVGYGIALVLFMSSGVWLAKIFPPDLRRMMVVCGLFTVFVSIFIGGVFGWGEGLWINPIEQPIPLLKLVIFIGIAHLIMALGFAGILKDIYRKDWKAIIFNRASKIMILVGLFGLSFCVLGIGLREFGIDFVFPRMGLFQAFNPLTPAPLTITIFRVIFYLGLAVGITGAVIVGKSAREKLGGPINVIYGITGLIADVTSYSRLLALGIATGVIAFSINFIVKMAWDGMVTPNLSFSPAVIIAILAAIGIGLVLVAAHSFNIFINSLGGFIHTMRLHFAEFFGKFYESGGEKFTPFKAKRKFTKIKGGEWIGR
jgi:V/A-type H+-transporting ATPase subunit I